MAKMNFSKVEQALDEALRAISIEHIVELAAIANILHNAKVPPQVLEKIVHRFQQQLKKIKSYDIKLYERLQVTPEDEKRFSVSFSELNQEDWAELAQLKIRIDELKKELYGQASIRPEDEERIEQERIKHINKRFNIREGWLPLK